MFKFYSLILGLSAGIQSAGDSVPLWVRILHSAEENNLSPSSIQCAGELASGAPGSNPAFSRGTQLVSFRFEYRLPVPEHRN